MTKKSLKSLDFPSSGPSGINKKKTTRRKHRNSHLGCTNCKLRRIKCDETTPACNNCLKGKLKCSYLGLDAVTMALMQITHQKSASVLEQQHQKQEQHLNNPADNRTQMNPYLATHQPNSPRYVQQYQYQQQQHLHMQYPQLEIAPGHMYPYVQQQTSPPPGHFVSHAQYTVPQPDMASASSRYPRQLHDSPAYLHDTLLQGPFQASFSNSITPGRMQAVPPHNGTSLQHMMLYQQSAPKIHAGAPHMLGSISHPSGKPFVQSPSYHSVSTPLPQPHPQHQPHLQHPPHIQNHPMHHHQFLPPPHTHHQPQLQHQYHQQQYSLPNFPKHDHAHFSAAYQSSGGPFAQPHHGTSAAHMTPLSSSSAYLPHSNPTGTKHDEHGDLHSGETQKSPTKPRETQRSSTELCFPVDKAERAADILIDSKVPENPHVQPKLAHTSDSHRSTDRVSTIRDLLS